MSFLFVVWFALVLEYLSWSKMSWSWSLHKHSSYWYRNDAHCVYPFLVKLWWLEGRCHFQLDRLMILDDGYDKGCHIVKSFLWGLGVQTKPPAQVTFPYRLHIPPPKPPKPTPWYSKNSRSKALFPLSHCFVCWVNNFIIFSLRKTNKLP